MLEFSSENINQMEHLYRINLINSCSGYKSANLIGTKSKEGISNVAIFSSVTHLGSNPALLGFFIRPKTVMRNTYSNIKATGKYTINHIHSKIIEDAHHTSAKYDSNISEFDTTNLIEDYKGEYLAPFVKNSPVQIAMQYLEEYPITANNTILVIGKIEKLFIDNTLVEEDGFVNLSKGDIATINGLDGYSIPKLQERLEYQRPKSEFKKTTI
ncbi:flavin reductase family protein [Winogradskyella thalassocola]|uniref:NADH-FMN oxidoreductase RutF, flavin reductase (DIM6/NTAB) family n=1 Tax=Winogradskyella thalassocola TaxID=262004 RepID=A0A1G8BAL1_9FLAO|nr:flavin reductase [Winogradskyella thalassocola]SDH30292.1 NADH-FMN oxidoreductase RutF, flavin reductase (DIM6/NTAB) family [Winogradskyella thalassocola]